MIFCVALVLVAIVGDCIAALSLGGPNNSSGRHVSQALPAEAVNFMQQFGYLEKGSSDAEALIAENTIVEAVKLVQRYGGLPETGVLDSSTAKVRPCLRKNYGRFDAEVKGRTRTGLEYACISLFNPKDCNPSKPLMKSRRCGCPDILSSDFGYDPSRNRLHISRRKRYVIAQGWKKRNIKYKLANWSSKMSQSDMAHEMQRAFDAWAMYSGLKFKRVDDPRQEADILIQFSYQYHYDDFPFDGAGGVLAHAFYPYERAQFSGQIHFDEEEPWAVNATTEQIMNGAVDFYRVAVHELGHSLGLGHSHVTSSIMFPYYQGMNGAFVLGDDDVRAMHELYIARHLEDDDDSTTERATRSPPLTREPRPPPPRTTPTRPPPSIPTRPTPPLPTRQPPARRNPPRRRTTTTRPPSTTTLTFEGDHEDVDSHKRHNDKHVHGPGCGHSRNNGHYHHHKHHAYPESPSSGSDDTFGDNGVHSKNESNHDICSGNFGAAALLRGELFIFKGTHLWRLRDRGHIMKGYPALIKQMFTKFPEGTVVDAAYQRPTDGSIVLFVGNQLWVYTGSTFIEDSPRPLTHVGLPSNLDRLDAAMVWSGNGATYFFRKDQFWRFNETTRRIDPGYPDVISVRWRGIPSNIDAALSWTDGRTYFFKGAQYWEFDRKTTNVSRNSPQPAVTYWLGC